MTTTKLFATASAAALTLFAACAPAPDAEPRVVYAQPTFDKLGNPSCRPVDAVPGDAAFNPNVPPCGVLSIDDDDDDMSATVSMDDDDDDDDDSDD